MCSGVENEEVHRDNMGWSPVYAGDIAVMSVGFMLSSKSDAIIWRGPRKNGKMSLFVLTFIFYIVCADVCSSRLYACRVIDRTFAGACSFFRADQTVSD